MEGKRLAAWCLLVVVLLSTQQRPAAAMSKFCRCYKPCYADCRKDTPPYPCNFRCLQDCFNNVLLPPARPTSPADCNRICLIRVCGVMSTASMTVAGDDAEAAACLVACCNSIGHSAPRKDTTD